MSNGITLEFEVHFKRGAGGKRLLRPGPDPSQDGPVVTGGKIPRIARLMALAVRFEGLVRRGEVDDYAAVAELGRVTRARVAQITNLLNLAPDIQEALLFHPPVPGDRAAVSERELREICALICWDEQRERWRELNDAFRAEPAPSAHAFTGHQRDITDVTESQRVDRKGREARRRELDRKESFDQQPA